MKYILVDRRILDQPNVDWEQLHACLVVADDHDHARELARDNAFEEGAEVWMDPDRASVLILGEAPDQEARLLLMEHAG